jgi:hypothetical protein
MVPLLILGRTFGYLRTESAVVLVLSHELPTETSRDLVKISLLCIVGRPEPDPEGRERARHFCRGRHAYR